MKVKLTRSWFTPDNRLLKPGVHEVPDGWDIPSGTEVIEEELPLVTKRGAK